MAASSDAGYLMSDAPSRTPRRQGFPGSSSSAVRPRGPPSENPDDDADGFADDQVPRSSRPGASNGPIPRVEDKIGLIIQEHFEGFIESFVEDTSNAPAMTPGSSAMTSDK